MDNKIVTLIAFDYGERRIGVAIGNTLTCSARPLRILDAKDKKKCFEEISKIIQDWSPDRLVVGLPIYPDGSTHPFSKKCQKFANKLFQKFGVEVTFEDERWTSKLAKGKKHDDARAATIILEGVLNASAHSA